MNKDLIGGINLYNCDCMSYLKSVPDGYFDLAIVDPPYGIGASNPSKKPNIAKQKNGSRMHVKHNVYTRKDWDLKVPSKEYFSELVRVSKNQIIWGINYLCNSYSFGVGRIVWDKMNGGSDQYGCEIAYCSLNNRTDIVHYLWRGMFQGVNCSNKVKECLIQQGNKGLNQKRIHPTEKPILLYKWLLNNYAKKGDKILDTHFGSLSIGLACHDLGFELSACEMDEEYYNLGVNRLKEHQRQLSLGF